ncbi:hypothetical protein P5F75_13035 [Caldifermentibacillus hisashii]|uniref:hypothetical protein n=1 Tax=Caldifermentibacillus hisashii TaxID=996558 RepID=UPI002E1E56FD|nr:hypothetical protein [Caldifermentibacillus hisashii]
MDKETKEFEYSDDETLTIAIGLIKKGWNEEKVQMELGLTDDDMDLIDFVINEF